MENQTDSIMFKVDHSEEFDVQENKKRTEENMFNREKVILEDGQKRKVIYGGMEEQKKTYYEILQPYIWKMVEGTGTVANQAGKGLYEALKIGATWIYDKLTNNVIPYAVENVPKLIFVVKNEGTQNKYRQSDSFQVLEIQDNEYAQLNKKEKAGKKRIVVPLDPEQDPKFIKFLQKQNYVSDGEFPIDSDDEQIQQQSYMIPSANFLVVHEEIKKKHQEQYEKSKQFNVMEEKQAPKETNDQEEEIHRNYMTSETYYENLAEFNKPKKYLKLKDCFIFEYEGKNSIEYDFLDNIERDENTKSGYLVQPQKVITNRISSDSNDSFSGQVPVLTVQQEITIPKPRVKIQIPAQKLQQKQQELSEKEIQYA